MAKMFKPLKRAIGNRDDSLPHASRLPRLVALNFLPVEKGASMDRLWIARGQKVLKATKCEDR